MNKIILLAIVLSVLISCNKEACLEPTGVRDDYFSVSVDATDEVSVLRRDFYEKNKVHILFNDTLRHEQRGTYADGSPYWFTEVLELDYSMTSGGNNALRFNYLKDIDEQKKGADFVERYILPHLVSPMRPYSVILFEKLEQKKGAKWKALDFYNGMRCFALSMQNIFDKDDDELKEFFADIFYDMIYNKLETMNDEVLETFYVFGAEFYDEYYMDCGFDEKPSLEELLKLGFLGGLRSFFYDKYDDMESYLEALFYWEEDSSFEEYYVEYPVVIQKYEILKKIIEDLGYKF